MKNWIIEQDSMIMSTRVFAVRAENMEEAIDKVERGSDEGVSEIRSGEYPIDLPYSYEDSREEEEGEEEYFEDLD